MIFLGTEFNSVVLLEQYYPRYRYRVPKGNKTVGHFFTLMESLKEKFDIDEYSASQTTLEQIFNGFARDEDNQVQNREFKIINGEISSSLNQLHSSNPNFENGKA